MDRTPRYRSLAETLKAEIASGRYPVGSQLPPELELCRAHGVSRHTARDAIRLLREAGLVERKRGAGTTVVAQGSPRAFVQPLGGVEDLLQYAREARLQVERREERPLTAEEAATLGVEPGAPWLVIGARRVAEGRPVALSRIFVPPPYTAVGGEVGADDRSVQDLLNARFGIATGRIDQRISAETLAAYEAKLLQVEKGSAALRTLRRYYAADGALILASDNLHPGSRFAYAMSYRREG